MGIPGERERGSWGEYQGREGQSGRIPGERERGSRGEYQGRERGSWVEYQGRERGAVGENTRGRGTFTVCASNQAISTENFTVPIEFVKY